MILSSVDLLPCGGTDAAAVGWLELGNHLEANEELERIRPEWRAHPDVFVLRFQIYGKGAEVGLRSGGRRRIHRGRPIRPARLDLPLQDLYFTKRIQQAYDIATRNLSEFPNDAEFHYDTACHACLLGKMKEAEDFLKRTFELVGLVDAKQLRLHALSDS